MNIMVVRTDKLGDFITTLPAIYCLKQYNVDNIIVVCVSPLNKELAESFDFIDSVIVDDGCSVFELAKYFRDAKIDVSITMFSNTRVACAQFLAGIDKRIAPATKMAQFFYTQKIKQRRSQVKMAEFEYNIALAKILFPQMDVTYPQPLMCCDRRDNSKKNTICFHVGSGGSSDANWHLNEYIVLIEEALKSYHVVLTFGPDESRLMEDMQDRIKNDNVTFYQSQDGLLAFADYICGMKLFVSTSTGTYHLASLLGIPTMTFFADSLFASAKRWKGVGDIRMQMHYTIPMQRQKREELLVKVKKRLQFL